jgi:hypothetical protein
VLIATASWPAQFAGTPSLVNVNGAGVQGNADSGSVAIAADGALVAFASDADDLVSLDTNGDTDVFVHDTISGITTRVSVNYQGEEAQGDNECPALSADGRYVAFISRAWNMRQAGRTSARRCGRCNSRSPGPRRSAKGAARRRSGTATAAVPPSRRMAAVALRARRAISFR